MHPDLFPAALHRLTRRSVLLAASATGLSVLGTGTARALPPKAIAFPRDRGSHPDFRTEWWYITGNAASANDAAREFGFQLTFFRSRVDGTQAMDTGTEKSQLKTKLARSGV